MEKKNIFIIDIFIIIFIITGCGHIKNAHEIVQFVNDNYGINSEVVSYENDVKDNRYFILKDLTNNFTFNCRSFMDSLSIDGSFGSMETTTCNYYDKLTDYLIPQIKNIENKYSVKFIRNEGDQLISQIEIPEIDEKYFNNMELDNVTKAFNELNKLYNFRKIPDSNVKTVFICLYNSHKITDYYFEYTQNGDMIQLFNSHTEFYKERNIPFKIEKDVLDFVNSKYGDGFEIIDYQYLLKKYSGFDCDGIIYIVENKKLGLLKEVGFNVEKYCADYKDNQLKTMDYYYSENIKTYWYTMYNFN